MQAFQLDAATAAEPLQCRRASSAGTSPLAGLTAEGRKMKDAIWKETRAITTPPKALWTAGTGKALSSRLAPSATPMMPAGTTRSVLSHLFCFAGTPAKRPSEEAETTSGTSTGAHLSEWRCKLVMASARKHLQGARQGRRPKASSSTSHGVYCACRHQRAQRDQDRVGTHQEAMQGRRGCDGCGTTAWHGPR